MATWSGLRKELEQDRLCPALRGRVQYFATHYHGAPDDYGRVCVRVDGKEYAHGNPYAYYGRGYCDLERVLKAAHQVPGRVWTGKETLYEAENAALEAQIQEQALADGAFSMTDFQRALEAYRQTPIQACLESSNPLVRMFAVLDRRVGKRTLMRLRGSVAQQPDWLAFFYRLRLEAEGIASPVLSVACAYRRPVRYGETARIRVRLTAYNGVKLSVAYRVEDAATGQERAAGESTHAFLDSKTGMPLRLRRACPELDEILQVQIERDRATEESAK